jgi:eukaryotic translation initiation factor 2C
VAEGQFEALMKEEIASLRRACLNLTEGYMPKITYIVVQKRHHTRLFAAKPSDECGRVSHYFQSIFFAFYIRSFS